MKVRDVMTPNPRTVTPEESIQTTARIMRDEDTGVVPVVEGEMLAGIITDRDIVVRAVAEGKGPATKVREVMTAGRVVRADPDMTTRDASDLMARHQVRRLPVVENDRLVGIVSLGDIAVKEGKDSRTGDTLENISEGVKKAA
jgi:CBS domain-containing protein